MFKKTLGIALLIMGYGLLVMSCFAQEEKLTITTYYPSPYGSYRELTAYRMKIGRIFSGSDYTIDDDNFIVEGRVGIGTNIDAGTKVRINGPTTAGSRTLTITDGATSTLELGLATQSTAQRPYIYANTNLAFGTNGAERMVINNTGNVGIGTVNPVAPLDVQTGYSGSDGMVRIGETQIWDNEINRYSLNPDGTPTTAGTDLLIQNRNPSNYADPNQGIYSAGNTMINRFSGNVGIGTTSLQSPAPGPGGTPTAGNLDVNDVYLRSIGRWASQSNQYVYISPSRVFARGICKNTIYADTGAPYTNINQYVTVGYPPTNLIPASASAIIVKFYAQADEDTTWISVRATHFPEDFIANAVAYNNADDAASDTNTIVMPYETNRQMQIRWFGSNGDDAIGVRAYVVGYIQ